MGLLPLDQFLCWKLKIATLAVCGYFISFGGIACLLEIFDIAAFSDSNFEVKGGFKSHWRSHVWEGWLATNIVMMVCHFIIIGYSILMIFAVKRFPTYYEFNLTKGFLALIIMYILVELGIGCYRYSWYAANTFRLAYLVFTFLFWIIRTILSVTCCVVIHSRISEVKYEITYGERKTLDPYASQANLLRSGAATPVPRGWRTPQGTFA